MLEKVFEYLFEAFLIFQIFFLSYPYNIHPHNAFQLLQTGSTFYAMFVFDCRAS